MKSPFCFVGLVLAVLLSGRLIAAAASLPRGYTSSEMEVTVSVWFGGFDYLPNGKLVFSDSQDVFVLDGEGTSTVVAHFETPGLFGSFVKVAPDGHTVFVGESSVGTVSKFDLNAGGIQSIGPGTASIVANVALNYDLEFDSGGRAFVSAAVAGSDPPVNHLLLLETDSGETDLVVEVKGYSGPLVFDVDGNLFYSTSTSYPPAPVESVILFQRDEIDGAIGPGNLTDADAETYASEIYGFSDMVFDDDGDLFGATSSGAVAELSLEGAKLTSRTFAAVSPDALGATLVRFLPAKRRFEAFYQDGGTLTFLESDFWSLYRLVHVKPFPEFCMTGVQQEQQGTKVGFATEEEKKYRVFWSDDPVSSNGWQALMPAVLGTGEPLSILDAGDEQAGRPSPSLPSVKMRFYRVELVQ